MFHLSSKSLSIGNSSHSSTNSQTSGNFFIKVSVFRFANFVVLGYHEGMVWLNDLGLVSSDDLILDIIKLKLGFNMIWDVIKLGIETLIQWLIWIWGVIGMLLIFRLRRL